MPSLAEEVRDRMAREVSRAAGGDYRRYRGDPFAYARDVLGVRWWEAQRVAAEASVRHQRVMIFSAHGVGKSHFAGGMVNWHYDCFDPGITLTTAPSERQVIEVLWGEVRAQRRARPGLAPRAPMLRSDDKHFAVGYTAKDAAAFQGRHEEHVFILFDEAIAIEDQFWDAAEGMMLGEGCRHVAIFNPTDTATRAYEESLRNDWHVLRISALDHPNIAAELAGEPPPYPKAVRLQYVQSAIRKWCVGIAGEDRRSQDFEFPPGSGEWHRPGPLAESRLLGRWPSAVGHSVWSQARWERALVPQPVPQRSAQAGCDVARFGEDFTSIVLRRGSCVLHHETHNGWDGNQIAGRIKLVVRGHVEPGEVAESVPVAIDDLGGTVADRAEGWNFQAVSAADPAIDRESYPNRRSELWFAVAERADVGDLDLSRLSEESRTLLYRQVMAPTWRENARGQREVESKDKTRSRIGRSPDDADAMNLCFTPAIDPYDMMPLAGGRRATLTASPRR